MPSGNLFRREQRANQRVQTNWANRQFFDFRVPLERTRAARMRRQARAEPERDPEEENRRAEEEARQRELERLRREAQIKAEQELERQRVIELRRIRQQQARAQKSQMRDQADQLAAHQRALLQQQQLAQRQLARQQAQQQFDLGNLTVAQLRVNLPALRARVQQVQPRVNSLVVLLAGSAAPELAQLTQDATDLPMILMRCGQGKIAADAARNAVANCPIDQEETVMAQHMLTLQPYANDYPTDLATVTAAETLALAAEQAYVLVRTLATTYPYLGLTLALVLDPLGPTNRLTNIELAALNTKLIGHRVSAWTLARLPATRHYRTGQQMYVPRTLQYFPYQPSSEVFHDWIWEESEGHGQAASSMRSILDKVASHGDILGTPFTWTNSSGKHKITHPNMVLNVILDPTQTVLITYYRLS